MSACSSRGSSRWSVTPCTAWAARAMAWRSPSSGSRRSTRWRHAAAAAATPAPARCPTRRRNPQVRRARILRRLRSGCQAESVPGDRGDDGDDELDYRFTLANERTFLAWIRTSLALLAGGIALRAVVEPFGVRGVRTTLAVTAVALSFGLAVASYVRWTQIDRAMRRGEPLPHPMAEPVVATVIAVMAGVAAVFLVVRGARSPPGARAGCSSSGPSW